jgi:hypothetical protein
MLNFLQQLQETIKDNKNRKKVSDKPSPTILLAKPAPKKSRKSFVFFLQVAK